MLELAVITGRGRRVLRTRLKKTNAASQDTTGLEAIAIVYSEPKSCEVNLLRHQPASKNNDSNHTLIVESCYTSRLSDKMVVALNEACEVGNLEAAANILTALE